MSEPHTHTHTHSFDGRTAIEAPIVATQNLSLQNKNVVLLKKKKKNKERKGEKS